MKMYTFRSFVRQTIGCLRSSFSTQCHMKMLNNYSESNPHLSKSKAIMHTHGLVDPHAQVHYTDTLFRILDITHYRRQIPFH